MAVSRLFLIDKPAGASSFTALGTLKKRLGTRKVGHAGTLDPFATGLLTALSGKLTRAAFLLADLDKSYRATIRFGEETDTLDTEGEVVARDSIPSLEAIRDAASRFSGEILQIPPRFSAVKINGRRAYADARLGRNVEIPQRRVRIHRFDIESWDGRDLEVSIACSKGTYIRSIARDLGLAAGSRAYCRALRRTSVGPFDIAAARRPDDLGVDDGWTPERVFDSLGLPLVPISLPAVRRALDGVPPTRIPGFPDLPAGLSALIGPSGNVAALMENHEGRSGYRIVFDSGYPKT